MKEKCRKKRKNILYNVGMRWRIFIYLLGFAFIMICLLWVFQIIYLNEFYEKIKKDQISTAASSIISQLDSDPEDLQSYMEEISLHYNLCSELYLLDNANNIFFGSEKLVSVDILSDCILHHISERDTNTFYYKAQENPNGYVEIYSRVPFSKIQQDQNRLTLKDDGLSKSMIYARLASDSQGNNYLLLLNSSITPVSATVATLRVQLIVISVILIIAALAFSLLIARRLSNPINKLNRAARAMAEGDLNTNFPGEGYREIAELAASLNFAESELSRTDKMQKDLVANISHDIRTPLTMIGGYAEYMRDFPDEDHSESIQVIVEESERLRNLVNDILDNSRIMAGASTVEKQVFDLSESLNNFTSNFNHLIEPKGYRVETDIAPNILVNADEKRILQAVSNMLNNAAAHIGEDKLIRVSLQPVEDPAENSRHKWYKRQDNDREEGFSYGNLSQPARGRKSKAAAGEPVVRLTVSDNGSGIDEKDLPYIWERYYHAEDPKAGGHISGLGLSIVRGIMEMHGARYGVNSRPGAGSSFWFELPIVQADSEESAK